MAKKGKKARRQNRVVDQDASRWSPGPPATPFDLEAFLLEALEQGKRFTPLDLRKHENQAVRDAVRGRLLSLAGWLEDFYRKNATEKGAAVQNIPATKPPGPPKASGGAPNSPAKKFMVPVSHMTGWTGESYATVMNAIRYLEKVGAIPVIGEYDWRKRRETSLSEEDAKTVEKFLLDRKQARALFGGRVPNAVVLKFDTYRYMHPLLDVEGLPLKSIQAITGLGAEFLKAAAMGRAGAALPVKVHTFPKCALAFVPKLDAGAMRLLLDWAEKVKEVQVEGARVEKPAAALNAEGWVSAAGLAAELGIGFNMLVNGIRAHQHRWTGFEALAMFGRSYVVHQEVVSWLRSLVSLHSGENNLQDSFQEKFSIHPQSFQAYVGRLESAGAIAPLTIFGRLFLEPNHAQVMRADHAIRQLLREKHGLRVNELEVFSLAKLLSLTYPDLLAALRDHGNGFPAKKLAKLPRHQVANRVEACANAIIQWYSRK